MRLHVIALAVKVLTGEIKYQPTIVSNQVKHCGIDILASKAVKFLRKNLGKKVVIEHESGKLFDTEILQGNLYFKYVKDYPVVSTQVSKITLESLNDGTVLASVEKPSYGA